MESNIEAEQHGAKSEALDALMAELDEYPDARIELAFEIAAEHRRLGQPDQAVTWLREAVAAGGFDGAMARVELAELYLDAGDDTAAATELTALRKGPDQSPEAFEYAAEMFDARGDRVTALHWFDMAAARLPATALGEIQIGSIAGLIASQRQRLREGLGFAPDALDEAAARARPARPGPGDGLPSERTARAKVLTVLVWPQHDFGQAQQRWPQLVEEATDHVTYRTTLELQFREATASGAQQIRLIPARLDVLEKVAATMGLTPVDPPVRRNYVQALDSTAAAWPPGRNSPCWCGSGAKYKVCCLRVR